MTNFDSSITFHEDPEKSEQNIDEDFNNQSTISRK